VPDRDGGTPEVDVGTLNPPLAAGRVEPPGPPGEVGLDDRATMIVGSVAFGLAIPRLTGLFGVLGPGDGAFWVGLVGFIALAAAIWLGNRWLLFKQRQHFDWFSHPLRKLAMLVVANVLYTAPVTLLGLLGWFAYIGVPLDRTASQVVVLTNVICVLFVTHGYETMFLIRERESDLLRVERLDRLRVQAELAALKTQVDPHFLFNSLNTLGHLIQHDARRGREFCDTLADVYRYVLDSGQRDLVPLSDELAFVRHYHRLLELRSGGAIRLAVDDVLERDAARWRIAPLALQVLLENAVKHNQTGADEPLELEISLRADDAAAPVVRAVNVLRPRRSALPSAGVGLANLAARCDLVTGATLSVRAHEGLFTVDVPLRGVAA
jgi:hypothetical protein